MLAAMLCMFRCRFLAVAALLRTRVRLAKTPHPALQSLGSSTTLTPNHASAHLMHACSCVFRVYVACAKADIQHKYRPLNYNIRL